jgi:tetratricopeptide (TPR) repeat protein
MSDAIPRSWLATAGRYHSRLVEAAMAMNDNALHVAEPLLRAHLKDDPFDVAAIRMFAELAGRIGRYRDAEALLRRAVELAPSFVAARANLALVLYRQNKPVEALAELEQVVAEEPDNPGHANLRAAAHGRMGDFDAAIGLYESVLEQAPDQPRVWLSYGHMLKTVGRQADGITAYRRAIALRPTLGEAWWSLANLKTVGFAEGDIAAMKVALADTTIADPDRFHLDFALGKALEDRGQAAASFGHYAAGNALRRQTLAYDGDALRRQVDRIVALLTPEFLAARAGQGCDAPDPIFILGMPRAGSTLIEQMLASHSRVEGTSELADLPQLARAAGPYPGSLADLAAGDLHGLGARYLQGTRVQRHTERPFFIDKLPNNWLYVPLILLALPRATIIDARRHPLACCFSNFKQHYARGQSFSYDLADMGRYYRDYVRLMAHVDAVAPGRVHRVIHEALVADTEAELRALLAACGLDYEPACLEFHKTQRPVRTASSEQVRQPISRAGTDAWQPYEPWLEPLKAALGPVLDAYPQAPSLTA